MRIALSTPTYDLAGDLLFDALPESKAHTYTRRIQRTATIDGGAVLDDMGYTNGDRSIEFEVAYSEAAFDSLRYLVKNYGAVNLAAESGFYYGAIERVERDADLITVQFLAESGV